jgi:hypothetical protein
VQQPQQFQQLQQLQQFQQLAQLQQFQQLQQLQQLQQSHLQLPPQPSDYETDTPVPVDLLSQPPPPRTNADLNLSVIKRHNPDVVAILSIAHYAVVYLFSPTTQQWEKCGIEGTMFVCQLTPSSIGADRYSVMILNRRGLDNFTTELLSADDVEITEEYIILQIIAADGMPQVFGLWIFSEPPPSSTADTRRINAQIIVDCATQAELSRKALEQRQRDHQNGNSQDEPEEAEADDEDEETEDQTEEDDPASVAMGRQISLRELFGKQREQDSAWSVHIHNSPTTKSTPQFVTTMDTDFFRSYTPQKQGQGQGQAQPKVPQNQAAKPDVLGDLFRKASQRYEGNG